MYEQYECLNIKVDSGVALVTITQNLSSHRQHYELSRIWNDLRDDEDVRAIVTTGVGRAYVAGPELGVLDDIMDDPAAIHKLHIEARDLVHNMMNLDKPIIAAINGAAYGHGLAVALMSDITICAEEAKLLDRHAMLGVAAGDHAALIWPWLVGLGKTKYYLMTGEMLDGKEAAKIGLVNEAVPYDALMDRAMKLATNIAAAPPMAMQGTKRALNQWLRLGATTAFDYSLALEMLSFYDEGAKQGLRALKEQGMKKR